MDLIHLARITLPRWVDVPAEHGEWNRKSAARLAAHEEGHYAIFAAVAQELYAAVLAVPTTAATCDELKSNLGKVVDEYSALAQEKNRAYDRDTEHGLKQPGFDD